MVKERLALVEKLGPKWEESAPNDYITWQISYALRHDDHAERTADRICYRIVVVNFASIYTTNFIATNAVFNIVSSPPSYTSLMKLLDSEGREFDPSQKGGQALILSGDQTTEMFLTQVQPGTSKQFSLVYDGPNDMQGLKLKIPGGMFSSSGDAVIKVP